MAENNNVKISELELSTSFSGSERIPMAVGGGNKSTSISALREYFKDSTLCVIDGIIDFAGIVDDSVISTATFREIVYVSELRLIVEEASIRLERPPVMNTYYTTNFNRWEDYLVVNEETGRKEIRQDRVFFNNEDKELYTFNGELNNLFDTVRINTMTEEEFNNLQHPIEGAIYGIFEEE